jgi:hypothetical protein
MENSIQPFRMVDPAIFEQIQAKIDEDAQVRDVRALSIDDSLLTSQEIRSILQTLERQGRESQTTR